MARPCFLAFAIVLLAVPVTRGGIAVSPLFSEGAVLQRSSATPVWGRAEPQETIEVRLGGARAEARADDGGRWRVVLDLERAGPGPHLMTVKGRETLTLRDVLVGEVWLASGQSNMEMPLRDTAEAAAEIARATDGGVREFTVRQRVAASPEAEAEGGWAVARPTTAGAFSAAGFYFARELRRELGAPVGIVHASWGATTIEAWMSEESLRADPALAEGAERARADAELMPRKKPAALFNGMIHPLIPVRMRGIIWYQGESNYGRAWQYRTTFPRMIEDWRARWGLGDIPFLFCQLASFGAARPEPGESAIAELREAQTLALALPNTGQAVLLDAGDATDVHPRDKRTPGARLALIALAKAYGRRVEFSGPVYRGVCVEGGGRVRLAFDHATGGLVAGPSPGAGRPRSTTGAVEGFAICGEDRRWVRAAARIEGGAVVAWAPEVPRPVAVRYAWADNPVCNLYNGSGLPAGSFRTDDFPARTRDARF